MWKGEFCLLDFSFVVVEILFWLRKQFPLIWFVFFSGLNIGFKVSIANFQSFDWHARCMQEEKQNKNEIILTMTIVSQKISSGCQLIDLDWCVVVTLLLNFPFNACDHNPLILLPPLALRFSSDAPLWQLTPPYFFQYFLVVAGNDI